MLGQILGTCGVVQNVPRILTLQKRQVRSLCHGTALGGLKALDRACADGLQVVQGRACME